MSYGIEATGPIPTGNTGVKAFPNYGAYVKLVAAICQHHGWGMDRVKAHKEIAPDRKIDPVFNMADFRVDVAAVMQGQPSEEDDMTPEESRQLKAIYESLIVPGTLNPEQTLNKQFDRMREIQTGMVVPGTRTVGEAYELLFARVRTIERNVATLVEQLGTAEPPTPTP